MADVSEVRLRVAVDVLHGDAVLLSDLNACISFPVAVYSGTCRGLLKLTCFIAVVNMSQRQYLHAFAPSVLLQLYLCADSALLSTFVLSIRPVRSPRKVVQGQSWRVQFVWFFESLRRHNTACLLMKEGTLSHSHCVC